MKLAMASSLSYLRSAFFFLVALDLSFQAIANDTDLIQFYMNLEYLDAEFFLFGALGKGLDAISPNLSLGGPPPIGAQKANLDPQHAQIIQEFGYQQVGHIRAITNAVGGIQRPLLNLSKGLFALLIDIAVGSPLIPPFDPYANSLNYLITAYAFPYEALVGYVGTLRNLTSPDSRSLVASLLGVRAGQDAVIRALLYQNATQKVFPYSLTVADFVEGISGLGKLARTGIKHEGIIVPVTLGAENRTTSNILSADANSLSYAKAPAEYLRIFYGTGNEALPGSFYPLGANGQIAKTYLTIVGGG